MMKHYGFILWMVTALAIGGWIAAMWFDDDLPLEYSNGVITPNPAKQGQQVTLTWNLKVHRLCPGSVQRILTDEDTKKVIAVYDPTPSSQTVAKGDTELKKTFMLTENMPPHIGYDAIVCFRCNLLQHFFPLCEKLPHVTFSVRPQDAGN